VGRIRVALNIRFIVWSSGVELQAGCGVTPPPPPPPPPSPPRHDDKAGAIRSSDCLSHSAGGAVGSNWVAGITWNWDVGGRVV
jgi:hypothetical protein